jgi:hypothetical protein
MDEKKAMLEMYDTKEVHGLRGLVVIVAPRGSGGTTVQLNMLAASDLRRGMAFTPHPGGYDMFSDAIHPAYIHSEFSAAFFHTLAENPPKQSYLLLDGLAYDQQVQQNGHLRTLMTKALENDMLVLVTYQCMLDIPKEVREKVNLWVISNNCLATESERKRIAKYLQLPLENLNVGNHRYAFVAIKPPNQQAKFCQSHPNHRFEPFWATSKDGQISITSTAAATPVWRALMNQNFLQTTQTGRG